jgi:hypothetical protein
MPAFPTRTLGIDFRPRRTVGAGPHVTLPVRPICAPGIDFSKD